MCCDSWGHKESDTTAHTKRWAEGIRVPAPLAGGGSTTARGIFRLCPASACQTGPPGPGLGGAQSMGRWFEESRVLAPLA